MSQRKIEYINDPEDGRQLERKTASYTYIIPNCDNAALNRYFHGKDGARDLATDWLFTYPAVQVSKPEPLLNPGDRIVVTVADEVRANRRRRPQAFAQGVSHCLIQPIITDLTNRRDDLKNPSKQSLSNYNCAIGKLEEYAQEYSQGIPIPALYHMVEDVS